MLAFVSYERFKYVSFDSLVCLLCVPFTCVTEEDREGKARIRKGRTSQTECNKRRVTYPLLDSTHFSSIRLVYPRARDNH